MIRQENNMRPMPLKNCGYSSARPIMSSVQTPMTQNAYRIVVILYIDRNGVINKPSGTTIRL